MTGQATEHRAEMIAGAAVLTVAAAFLAWSLGGEIMPRGGYEVTASFPDVDGVEIGLTEKHMMFLKNLPKCCYWDRGLDSGIWVFDVRDTLAMAGMAGMTVGAMISTLREKGLLRVTLGEVENMNGRTRRERYIELTDTGKRVAEVLGVE